MVLSLTLFFTNKSYAQATPDKLKPKAMKSPYIFTPEVHQQKAADIAAIYTTMAKYYEGVEKAETDLLDMVFHQEWLMKDTDNPEENVLNVEDKATFIKRVKNHGPYQGYAKERIFANVGIAYDNLAFIRVNKDLSRSSTCFFLFKIGGEWTIMDKFWRNRGKEVAPIPLVKDSYRTIEQLINDYYHALANTDEKRLRTLLHDAWDLKYVQRDGSLHVETKETFLQQLTARSKTDHLDYSQLLAIDLYHDGLAVVRIDQPSKSETTYLTIFKVGTNWNIVNERRAYK